MELDNEGFVRPYRAATLKPEEPLCAPLVDLDLERRRIAKARALKEPTIEQAVGHPPVYAYTFRQFCWDSLPDWREAAAGLGLLAIYAVQQLI